MPPLGFCLWKRVPYCFKDAFIALVIQNQHYGLVVLCLFYQIVVPRQ